MVNLSKLLAVKQQVKHNSTNAPHIGISEVQKATKLGFDLTDYFNKVYEVDKGQSTTNPHILASRIINNNDPITPDNVNGITNILYPGKITQAQLDSLSTASWNKFPCPLTEADKQNLYDFLGSHRKEGLYGFFLKSDGSPLYIGSSVNLPQRVRQYILPSKYHLIKGLIGEFVRGDNLHTPHYAITTKCF